MNTTIVTTTDEDIFHPFQKLLQKYSCYEINNQNMTKISLSMATFFAYFNYFQKYYKYYYLNEHNDKLSNDNRQLVSNIHSPSIYKNIFMYSDSIIDIINNNLIEGYTLRREFSDIYRLLKYIMVYTYFDTIPLDTDVKINYHKSKKYTNRNTYSLYQTLYDVSYMLNQEFKLINSNITNYKDYKYISLYDLFRIYYEVFYRYIHDNQRKEIERLTQHKFVNIDSKTDYLFINNSVVSSHKLYIVSHIISKFAKKELDKSPSCVIMGNAALYSTNFNACNLNPYVFKKVEYEESCYSTYPYFYEFFIRKNSTKQFKLVNIMSEMNNIFKFMFVKNTKKEGIQSIMKHVNISNNIDNNSIVYYISNRFINFEEYLNTNTTDITPYFYVKFSRYDTLTDNDHIIGNIICNKIYNKYNITTNGIKLDSTTIETICINIDNKVDSFVSFVRFDNEMHSYRQSK